MIEEKLNALNEKIAGKSVDDNEQRTSGIYSAIGLAAGLGFAFVRRKGVLGYAGYGIMGLFIGGVAGKIISMTSSQ